MRKLDPQLEYLVEEGADAATSFDEGTMNRFGLEAIPGTGRRRPRVEANVLVQYSGDAGGDGVSALEAAGLTIRGIAGDVVTGVIDVKDLEKLGAIAEIERVESARTVHPELDLAVPESRASLVHAGPPGRRGAGVVVGIVDTGCDFTHACFRKADGTSRILAIWDQGLTAQAGESSPAGFGYGVEYTQAQINAALASAAPFNAVRHRDPGLHGTHVTGIAAGDGSVAGNAAPGGTEDPAGTYIGVAPEADIIVVAARSNGTEGLGSSANTLDGVNYIFQRAQDFDRPCVINMSLGDNLGPHDGTSLLERGIDNLLGGQGRAFVKSAGNAGSVRIHAQGNLGTGVTQDVRFLQGAGDTLANQIDLWYDGADTFRVSIVDPTGAVQGPVIVGSATTLTFPGGNTVRVDHRGNDPFNSDKRIFMTFRQGSASSIRSGTWAIQLFGVSSPSGGRFDAWVQRGNDVIPEFISPHESNAMTISTPGTAREVITAANYSARGFSAGTLASSSSRGPTRDGRAAPTVASPGTSVRSASAENSGGDPYQTMSGTSMSAPHVTGAIALMFQKNRYRTQAQIKECIENSARTDAQTGPTPNTAWGHGKLDVKAAVDCVPSPFLPPPRSVVSFCPSVITVRCPRRSVPLVTCLRVSVVRTACGGPSVVTLCQSVPTITCTTASVPAITCTGPSVVDGCPSTPGGCFDPGTVVNPGPLVVNPGAVVVNRGVVNPGAVMPVDPGRFRPVFEDDAEEAFDPMDGLEVPEQGFFEYDESWFDGAE